MNSIAYIKKLAAKIVRAQTSYDNGVPFMSNSRFDSIKNEFRNIAPDHSLNQTAGGGKHLLSLNNEPFEEWYPTLPDRTALVIQPKIDGVALALRYISGNLTKAWTRSGRDVTRYAMLVPNIPHQIDRGQVFECRGELYAFNEPAPSSQRKAAAELRKKAPSCKNLKFCSFEIFNFDGTEPQMLNVLHELGFQIPTTYQTSNPAEVEDLHQKWMDGKVFSEYPTDGIVAKVFSGELKGYLGANSVSPNWGLALK